MNDANMPSATGVRVAGDRYQWMHAWSACLDLLADAENPNLANPGVAIGVEAAGLVPLDDVIYYRSSAPHTYMQVKWAVDGTTPVNLEYVSNGGLLRRIRERWAELKSAGEPIEVVLVSTRDVDAGDELASRRDTRTGKLVPRGAQPLPAALRASREAWAAEAGTDSAELLDLLSDMRFDTGVDLYRLRETLRLKMRASGLQSDDAAIETAISWIEQQVVAGQRHIELMTVQAYAETLRRSEPWSRISVATLFLDPNRRTARAAIDWSDKMDGKGDPHATISPESPHTWTQLAVELNGLRSAVESAKRILVTGSMRQATGFYVGSVFRRVLGFEVAIAQGPNLWTSDAQATRYMPDVELFNFGDGGELAILTCISADESASAVRAYLEREVPTVGRLVIIRPSGGITGVTAIPTPEEAAAFAQTVLSQARNYAPSGSPIHLFQAGPLGVSVLLGHYWNRVAPTIVYEHLGRDRYTPSFQVQA